MKWEEYVDHVRKTNPQAYEDILEMEALAKIVGALITKRNEKGLSQRDLAIMCDVPQSSVARIEAYTVKPNIETMLKLLKPLGMTLVVQELR